MKWSVLTYFISSENIIEKFKEMILRRESDNLRIIHNEESPHHFFNYSLSNAPEVDSFSYIGILCDQDKDLNINFSHFESIFYRIFVIIWDGTMHGYEGWRKRIEDERSKIALGGKPNFLCFDLTGTFTDTQTDIDIIQIMKVDFDHLFSTINSYMKPIQH